MDISPLLFYGWSSFSEAAYFFTQEANRVDELSQFYVFVAHPYFKIGFCRDYQSPS